FLCMNRAGRPGLAGAAAVLLAIKPHLVFLFGFALLLWAVDRRRWRVLAGGALAGLAATALPPARHPPLLGPYWEALAHRPPAVWLSPTCGSLLRLAFGEDCFQLQFVPPLLGLLWFLVHWRRCRRTWDWGEQAPLLLLVSFLTAPYGAWPFDLVVLLV